MKVLITGAAGFIGSHLAEACCRRGWEVVALDNLSLGSRGNLNWMRTGDKLQFVEGDVMDEAICHDLLRGCDVVFHQAARPSVPYSVEHPRETNDQNLNATLHLLIAARDAGVKRFLFASSSAIYGESEVSPKHEGLAPAPLTPYALQKYAAERYVQLFHSLYGLATVSLRYFNVFGPRQSFDSPYSGVIAKFCTAVLNGETPVVHGDGGQTRDFTYISNIVKANLLAAEAPEAAVAGKVFNAATGCSISLLDLLNELAHLTGREVVPEFRPAREGDIRCSLADNRAARNTFQYVPETSWREGLAQTLDFYRDLYAVKLGSMGS